MRGHTAKTKLRDPDPQHLKEHMRAPPRTRVTHNSHAPRSLNCKRRTKVHPLWASATSSMKELRVSHCQSSGNQRRTKALQNSLHVDVPHHARLECKRQGAETATKRVRGYASSPEIRSLPRKLCEHANIKGSDARSNPQRTRRSPLGCPPQPYALRGHIRLAQRQVQRHPTRSGRARAALPARTR